MGYQEFYYEFRKGVLAHEEWKVEEESFRFYPDGYMACDAEELTFIRMTNEKYYGIKSDVLQGDFVTFRIDKGSEEVMQGRYALQDLFELYERDGWVGVWQLLEDHMKVIRPFQNQNINSLFESYENIKERLMIRAINFTDNEAQLQNHVYRVFEDIALTVYVIIYEDRNGLGSTKLPLSCLEQWGKDENEVFETAFKNTMNLLPPRLFVNLGELIENNPDKGKFMEGEAPLRKLTNMDVPLVKTTKNINGAVAMFYPGVKERIAEMFDGSFYVAFTSIHEARVHRVGGWSPNRIKCSLDGVNRDFDREELLSRNVYLYNAKEKTFKALEI